MVDVILKEAVEMVNKKKIILSAISLLVIFTVLFFSYDEIYIEGGKVLMFANGKVSPKYVEFVMKKRGEMGIHNIVKYGEKKKKEDVCLKVYENTSEIYLNNKATDMVLEVYISRVNKEKYNAALENVYRELIIRLKKSIEHDYIRKLGTDEERASKVIGLIHYVKYTGFEEKNIDTIQDIAPLMNTKQQIDYVYSYLINYHQRSNSPYNKEILSILEGDLQSRLKKEEIEILFGRGRK